MVDNNLNINSTLSVESITKINSVEIILKLDVTGKNRKYLLKGGGAQMFKGF